MSDVFYQGFDLFEGQTREDFRVELSKGGWLQEIVQRRLGATKAGVMLVKGYTRDTLHKYLDTSADLYFIDGGHSEKTIEHDGQIVYAMKPDAVAVFDDYYLPGLDGFGCNKFIRSLSDTFDVKLLPVGTKRDDGQEIVMARVERRKENDADLSLQRRETYAGVAARNDGKTLSDMHRLWSPYAQSTTSRSS